MGKWPKYVHGLLRYCKTILHTAHLEEMWWELVEWSSQAVTVFRGVVRGELSIYRYCLPPDFQSFVATIHVNQTLRARSQDYKMWVVCLYGMWLLIFMVSPKCHHGEINLIKNSSSKTSVLGTYHRHHTTKHILTPQCSLVQEVAQKTNEMAGDGTTAATVLVYSEDVKNAALKPPLTASSPTCPPTPKR